MRTEIEDHETLTEISPASLSAYAQSAGWAKSGTYGDHSDVYTSEHEEYPEIILPRIQALGDYANIVSRLIGIFASAADMEQQSVYQDLVAADRDVIRIRDADSDGHGTVAIGDGVELARGAYDLILAAALALEDPRPVYHAAANQKIMDLMHRIRFGQTEHGGFALTVWTPPIPPPLQEPTKFEHNSENEPVQRRMMKQLEKSLNAARWAAELAATGRASAFSEVVGKGVSANLCDSLVRLIQPFPELAITISWARIRLTATKPSIVRFTRSDVSIFQEAARTLRAREPKPDEKVFGYIESLAQREDEAEGVIVVKGHVGGQNRSVTTLLNTSDYERAAKAHKERMPVILVGDLEQVGRRWKLLNPCLVDVITTSETRGRGTVGYVDHLKIALETTPHTSDHESIVSRVQILTSRAKILHSEGETEQALEANNKALRLLNSCDPATLVMNIQYSDIFANIGVIYRKYGDHDKSMQSLRDAIAYARRVDSDDGRKAEAYALDNLGLTLRQAGKRKEALSKFNEAVELRQQVDDKLGAAKSGINIARYLHASGRLPEARQYVEDALKTLQDADQELRTQASALSLLGDIMQTDGKHEDATENYKMALKLNEKVRYTEGMAIICGKLARLSILTDDLSKAAAYSDSCWEYNRIAGSNGNGIASADQIAGEVKAAREEYGQALDRFATAFGAFERNRNLAGALRAKLKESQTLLKLGERQPAKSAAEKARYLSERIDVSISDRRELDELFAELVLV